MNHYLGSYIGAAVNDPKHYPKKSLLEEEQKTVYTGESIQQMAKARWGKKKDGKAND